MEAVSKTDRRRTWRMSAAFLLAATALAACDDMLDKSPADSFTDDNFWTSERNVEGYANMFYNSFAGYTRTDGPDATFYWNKLSDDMVASGFADWYYRAAPAVSSEWTDGYAEIRRANVLIERLAAMDDNLSPQQTAHWLGVARMMRGWHYFKLVRMFGDVPLVMKSVDTGDDGLLYAARENRNVVMDSVMADLEFASENINAIESNQNFSREMALALLAETALYEGTLTKYSDSPDLQRSSLWLRKAKQAAAGIIAGGKFSLNQTYSEKYSSEDLSANPEVIFSKPYRLGAQYHSMVIYLCASTIIDGMSRDAFDSYLFSDGKPAGLTTKANSDAGVMKGDDISIRDLLEERDRRLSETIDTCVFYKGQTFKRFGRGIAMTSTSGYGIRKFDSEDIDDVNRYNNNVSGNYTHAPILTLARILLVYAEASAELGEISQQDLDRTVNRLRQRAQVAPLSLSVGFSDPANNMDVSDLLWEIRRERRVELMYDGCRYWDLVRWHRLHLLDTSVNPRQQQGANLANVPADKRPEGVNAEGYIDANSGHTRLFDSRYYLFPLPTGQLTLNPNLSQNPGW